MAEFLIKVQEDSNERLPQSVRNQWSKSEKDRYAYRLRPNDIIAVRPDGWEWGSKETKPLFVKVKVPGMPVSDQYTEKVYSSPDVISRLQRYSILQAIVTGIMDSGSDFVVIATQAGFEAVMVDNG